MRRSRSSSAVCVSSAISRSATTGFLSLSRSTVSAAPAEISRARCDASITNSKRLGTLSTQSSTVTRAMVYSRSVDRRAVSRRELHKTQGENAVSESFHPFFFGVFQRIDHLESRLAGDRVYPVRGDFSHRHQNEGAFGKPWMRQDERLGRELALALGAQRLPALVANPVGQDGIAGSDEIQIQRALTPPHAAFAPVAQFEL